ncbi:hypothetical protein M0R45_005139 [Rubus argutus]|uniref:Uncharacterized protein n=1 Tax=Rubus argutus TaxID=59490 RepID=A0AAW1YLV3_RUBAR
MKGHIPLRGRVNEVSSHSNLEDKVNKMSTLLSQVLNVNQGGGQVPQFVGVCSVQGHHSNQCPQLIENGGWESANAIGGYQQGGGAPQRPRYDPYSNTYNPGWRDHPNFKWNNNEQAPQPPQGQRPQGFMPRPQVPQNYSSNPNSSSANYDKMFEALTTSTQALVQGQQNQGKEIAELKKQMDQVVGFMSKIHETGKLPSNTIPNP